MEQAPYPCRFHPSGKVLEMGYPCPQDSSLEVLEEAEEVKAALVLVQE